MHFFLPKFVPSFYQQPKSPLLSVASGSALAGVATVAFVSARAGSSCSPVARTRSVAIAGLRPGPTFSLEASAISRRAGTYLGSLTLAVLSADAALACLRSLHVYNSAHEVIKFSLVD
jgi:hypothetical protein